MLRLLFHTPFQTHPFKPRFKSVWLNGLFHIYLFRTCFIPSTRSRDSYPISYPCFIPLFHTMFHTCFIPFTAGPFCPIIKKALPAMPVKYSASPNFVQLFSQHPTYVCSREQIWSTHVDYVPYAAFWPLRHPWPMEAFAF